MFEFFKDRNLEHSFDHLTKVFNRETITEYMDYLIKNNQTFCLCITDVDNFKCVNDSHGHLAGDEILTKVAQMLTKAVKKTGVVGRYGGDEFVIILEGVSEYKDVWKIFHCLNKKIASLKSECLGSTNITVTSGISRFPLDAKTSNEMFNLADKALYRGKTKGRNCFVIYLPEKHANLTFEDYESRKINTKLLISQLFNTLTVNGDIKQLINEVFQEWCNYFMFDHISIETSNNMICDQYYSIDENISPNHIDYKLLDDALNSIGLLNVNNIDVLKGINHELYKNFNKQGVKAVMCAKISAYGKDFGIIRVDMKIGRVWQDYEQSLVLTIANVIGIILYYQNKTL